MKAGISRRKFMNDLAIAGACIPLYNTSSFLNRNRWYGYPADNPDSGVKLYSFNFGEVSLTKGILKDQLDRMVDFYRHLDNDSLLKPMREAIGMTAPGRDMGGWYDLGAFAPAHCFGQIVGALSRFYAITRDASLQEKVHELVAGFDSTTSAKNGSFYKNHRYPAYVFDKHTQGLTEAFQYAGIDHSMEVFQRALQQALPYLPEKALTRAEMRKRPHKDISYTWDESYTLPENLFIAYQLTGNDEYKRLASRYLLNDEYFVPLSEGKPAFVGKHAYSHVNALSSAAKSYEISGENMYYQAITKAWQMIMETQQFASGGWGPNETFIKPGEGLLGKSLFSSKNHFETPCGSYAHCKLGRYLIEFTKDSAYGDNMERVIYNGSLSSPDPENNGLAFYYSSYQPMATKKRTSFAWPCCAGSLPLVVSDYVRDIYFHNEEDLYANLYINSVLKWKKDNTPVIITQQTEYPVKGNHHFSFSLQRPLDFTLYLRIPSWTDASSVSIRINDAPIPFNGTSGIFYPIARKWKDGDQLTLNFPLPDYTLAIDAQHPGLVAFMKGPLMMAGIQPGIEIKGKPVLTNDSYQAHYKEGDILFKPFYEIKDETYTTYFKM